MVKDLTYPNFVFGLRDGVTLKLPATDLTEEERITLIASIALALGLRDTYNAIVAEHLWAFSSKESSTL